MTMATFTPVVNAFRFYQDGGSESGSTPLAAQDTNITVDLSGGNVGVHLRVRIDETAGAAGATTDDWTLQYSKNGGAFQVITTSPITNIDGAAGTGLTNGSATTNRATDGITDPGSGSFVAGKQIDAAAPNVLNHQITASNFTEHVTSFALVAADLADADTLDFRYLLNAATFTHNVTPRITIQKGGNQSLALDSVAWSWSATAVSLEHGREIVPDSVAWSWSPQDAAFNKGRTIAVDSVAWSWTQQDVSLEHGREIVPETVAWSWSATAVTFTKGITFVPDSVAWSWAVQDVSLEHGREIVPASVSWSFTADAVSLEHGHEIVPANVSWSWAAQDVTLTHLSQSTIIPESVGWSWSAENVSLEHGRLLTAESVGWTWAAGDVTFTLTAASVAVADGGAGAGRKKRQEWKVVPLDEWLRLHHPEESVERQIEAVEEIAATIDDAPKQVAESVIRELARETQRVNTLVTELKAQSRKVDGLADFLEIMADYKSALDKTKRKILGLEMSLREMDDEEALTTIIYHA